MGGIVHLITYKAALENIWILYVFSIALILKYDYRLSVKIITVDLEISTNTTVIKLLTDATIDSCILKFSEVRAT